MELRGGQKKMKFWVQHSGISIRARLELCMLWETGPKWLYFRMLSFHNLPPDKVKLL